jgi:hypothetical protein
MIESEWHVESPLALDPRGPPGDAGVLSFVAALA